MQRGAIIYYGSNVIYDCFTYNGEKDVLDIRLHMLERYVDKFVILEAKTTFSGHDKPLYFGAQEQFFKAYWHKIEYYVIDEDYSEAEIALAESSPNTIGAKHWKNEFLQKESIKKALTHYKVRDDDLVYIGDVDEIWDGHYRPLIPEKLMLRVYAYQLNNLSNEVFWGTVVGTWGQFKDKTLNHVRSDVAIRGLELAGWHFTSMGGLKEVSRKLNDSYTTESYNTAEVQQLLPSRLSTGADYLGRPFQFTIDTQDWPQYLKKFSRKYKHLLK